MDFNVDPKMVVIGKAMIVAVQQQVARIFVMKALVTHKLAAFGTALLLLHLKSTLILTKNS
jgi:hypothetical protein